MVAERGNWNTQVQGAGDELAAFRSWPLQFGGFFPTQDVARAARVAVLGSVVRDQLFGPGTDPTGAVVRIRNQPFRVIGVLTRKGQAAMGQDQDDVVIVPLYHGPEATPRCDALQNIAISAETGVSLDDIVRPHHRAPPHTSHDRSG